MRSPTVTTSGQPGSLSPDTGTGASRKVRGCHKPTNDWQTDRDYERLTFGVPQVRHANVPVLCVSHLLAGALIAANLDGPETRGAGAGYRVSRGVWIVVATVR